MISSELRKTRSHSTYLRICGDIPLNHGNIQNRKDDHKVPRIFFSIQIRYKSRQKRLFGIMELLEYLME